MANLFARARDWLAPTLAAASETGIGAYLAKQADDTFLATENVPYNAQHEYHGEILTDQGDLSVVMRNFNVLVSNMPDDVEPEKGNRYRDKAGTEWVIQACDLIVFDATWRLKCWRKV